MAYLDELFDYKNRLMMDLVTNPRIIDLIKDDANPKKKPEDYIYTQLMPFEYYPETIEHGQTFICFDVEIQRANSKTFYDPILYVWVFTHKSKMVLPEGGVRTDAVCAEIVKTISGSRHYGLGELMFYSTRRFTPTRDYQGRQMLFHAVDFNRKYPTGQDIPRNRKDI